MKYDMHECYAMQILEENKKKKKNNKEEWSQRIERSSTRTMSEKLN